ncbi:bifunctional allantoicase/(S)-ureidoglycine aminohydrolase [Tranquillimonas alkanivorans]|uniref:(S)-ureidoglycine aminohydrolase n=1 Tax=Tranquillimonas alkanivorans TaxID=441119 RepID=A0A1I5NXK8_9RHOB|nr:bifunctional allantoicase/(S)-ureidoglycine aminohydrolase [Tranquillimonas alkanivorans]SFP26524.1 (S)-ureidoglycine aminohydrolase [Tranquillimonas alkanivorans]
MAKYFSPTGGLPPQSDLSTGRAAFTPAYAVIPHGVMRDIVTSKLPFWTGMRAWVIARPMTGFAETFSHYIVELEPGGGSERPELAEEAQGVVFVTAGRLKLHLDGREHLLEAGGYAYIAPGEDWQLHNASDDRCTFHWVRKAYETVDGLPMPASFVTSDAEVEPIAMPDTDGGWATTRFVDPDDLRHDMHVNIVTLQPGAVIPFLETHVMEHGLYVLQGKGVYQLNKDWVEVEAGDYMWLRAFCPQSCYAGGPEPFRYLLYKDVNRHMPLRPGGR